MAVVSWFLLLPVIGSFLWDGPWLVIFVALATLLRLGFPVQMVWPFTAEWLVALAADWGLHQWLPARPVARSRGRLLNESWILLWLALLFSPIPGMVIWQGTVGFDAAQRVQGFSKDVRRIMLVRIVKAIAIACLWAAIAWLRP